MNLQKNFIFVLFFNKNDLKIRCKYGKIILIKLAIIEDYRSSMFVFKGEIKK